MSTHAPVELLMFDLDGTLVATAPEIADAVNDTLAAAGLPLASLKQVEDWIGHGTRSLLIQAVAAASQSTVEAVRQAPGFAPIEADFVQHYQRRCGTRSHLYPQVMEVLLQLRAAGQRLAVVTNKEGRYTQTVLDAHGLTPLFDVVISGDTLAVKKPDPAGIQHCLQRWGLAPERALFVGDSSIDVATARNAGVRVWALPYGYNMGEAITACGPDRVIPDFSALLELLTRAPTPMHLVQPEQTP